MTIQTPPPGEGSHEDVTANENAIELKDVEGLSQGQIVRRRFLRHRGAIAGLVTLGLVALLAYSSIGVLGLPGWWKFDHTATNDVINPGGRPTLEMPVWLGGNGFALGDAPFGQDEIGRDIFARTMKGVQTSILVMLVIGVISALVGVLVGAAAGFYRGWIDQGLMRVTDLFITFPIIVIGAVLGKIAGQAGVLPLAIVLGLVIWPGMARLVRGDFLSLREREFVDAAKVAGASDWRIIRKHMIPNAMGVIIVNTTLVMSAAVLLEAALSFLGFGVKAPNISLGLMISQYQSAFSTRPWLFWWPGLFIIITVLSINFVGDGLRDAFDPRQKRVPSQRKMEKSAREASA
ncbi:ABC transporter permease [Nocardioides sp.]|uniref:ABC transporter permease n=1 Tax=Nocardioides sp. TaxID=35761 RepID=UPI002736CD4D|nr:ABC transporter permease [Nocardioides sp.]MDP3890345.1 ABC transporter permease [Nocardioides sp.]